MGRSKKYIVRLSLEDEAYLKDFVNKGKHGSKEIKKAKALLLLNEGKSDVIIAEIVDFDPKTISRIRKGFTQKGVKGTIMDKHRSGRPEKLNTKAKATLTAIACSSPPEGHSRWTLRLLSDKAVELELVDSISHVSIMKTLKKTN